MALPTIYKIHPAIGVARLGDSPADHFFVGPESPGRPPEGDPPTGTAVPRFKDGAGRIKPQAARFRIFEYKDNGKGKYEPTREMTATTKGVSSIQWTVHIANKKAAFFKFSGLLGDPLEGPKGLAPKRRNDTAAFITPSDRKKLWLDPGFRTIAGRNVKGVEFKKGTAPPGAREYWPNPAPSPPIEYLGQLRTDAEGRLLVIGGAGLTSAVAGAAPISNYANNDGWFDDVADGPVTATIKFDGVAAPVPVVGAWVLCAPPDFAPFAQNVVTLYDLLYDLAVQQLALPSNDAAYDGPLKSMADIQQEFKKNKKPQLTAYKPSFDDEIWPILKRALAAIWLFQPAQHQHVIFGGGGSLSAIWPNLADPAASPAVRQAIFSRLRPPGLKGDGAGVQNMPKLLGDDPYLPPTGWGIQTRHRLGLTATQYALLQRWANGQFLKGAPTPPSSLPPKNITPAGLDRAALENCVGGAFFPGIEVGWQIRHPALYLEPFRINHGATTQYLGDTGTIQPGHFTRQMALPWKADFLQCKAEADAAGVLWGWWPGQRPDFVYAKAADAAALKPMVAWHRATAAGVPANWPIGGAIPAYEEMLKYWSKFDFVYQAAGVMFEGGERDSNVP